MPRRTTKEVVIITVGEVVVNARSNGHNPRGEARSNGLTGAKHIGPTTRNPEMVATG